MRAYEIKVWPEAQETVWRLIHAADRHTLHHLSTVINREFALRGKHLYCFYMNDRPYDSESAYGSPRAETPRDATKTNLASIGLKKGKRFVYLFDFLTERLFHLVVQKVWSVGQCPPLPEVAKRAGVVPPAEENAGPPLPEDLCNLAEVISQAAWNASQGRRPSRENLLRELDLARQLARGVRENWELVRALERAAESDISGWLIALPQHLAAEGFTREAFEVLEAFGDLEPVSFLNEKPMILLQADRVEEACQEAEANTERFQDDPWVWAKSAELLWKAGRGPSAERFFRKALELAGGTRYLREAIVERLLALLEEMGKSEEARALAASEEKRRAKPEKA